MAFASVLVLAATPAQAQFGLLGQVLSDVRTSGSGGNSSGGSSQNDSHAGCSHGGWWASSDDDDGEGTLALLYIAGLAVTSPFWGPPSLMGDSYDSLGFFQPAPYWRTPGYMAIDRDPWPDERFWSVQVRAEYGDDFDGLTAAGGRLVIDTTPRWGLDTEFNRRREELGGGLFAELWTGDFNLVYRFAQCEMAQMRTGIGFNWLDRPLGSDFGFNFTYGGDFFPQPPWVISADLDWGKLGHASLFHIRGTVGVVVRNVEFYAGYDYYDVGSTHLDGLVVGVRLWF